MTGLTKLAGALTAVAVALVATALVPAAGASGYPNDPYFKGQWGLQRINSVASWKVATGKGVTVAVLDTGVNAVADLTGKVLPGGHDYVQGFGSPYDREGHGTYVAGIIAADTNNGIGVAGEAPDAKILPVRVLGNNGEGTSANFGPAIQYAADHGAQVINASLGTAGSPIDGTTDPVSVLYALAKGAVVVISAGNDAHQFCDAPAFDPGAICVGASDEFDRLAGFSNYGARLDVVAPGTDILSTSRFGYMSASGTSAAAPFVAGLAAQLMSMGANNILAGLIIRDTAKDLGLPGYDITYGFGRIDALAAVNLCKQICA
jgi:thermitase